MVHPALGSRTAGLGDGCDSLTGELPVHTSPMNITKLC